MKLKILIIIKILVLIQIELFGVDKNRDILLIHAKIFPKILIFKKDIGDSLKFSILSDRESYNLEFFKESIEKNYAIHLKNREFKVEVINSKMVDKNFESDALYFFEYEKSELNRILDICNRNSIITFAYSKEDLKKGMLISIDIKSKIYPIVNLETLKQTKVSFISQFLSIVKVFR